MKFARPIRLQDCSICNSLFDWRLLRAGQSVKMVTTFLLHFWSNFWNKRKFLFDVMIGGFILKQFRWGCLVWFLSTFNCWLCLLLTSYLILSVDGWQICLLQLFLSSELKCDMNFAVYIPPQAEKEKVPVLYWLSGNSTSGEMVFLNFQSKLRHPLYIWFCLISGLTCTEQNFVTKAGAQRTASEQGVLIVAPDTSPRKFFKFW